MSVSLAGELERSTLAEWVHLDSPADNRDLLEFLIVQLAEVKAEAAERLRRHERDAALEQEILDLTELCGTVADAYRWQRRQPVDPHHFRSLEWLLWVTPRG